MKIKKILNRNRRDFSAVYECEHCGHTHKDSGYDDDFFHNTVIPDMKCRKCGKKSEKDYKPLKPKYNSSQVV